MVKFLIIGDLHGQKPKIYFKDFDAIIVPGDIASDAGVRPHLKAWFKALKEGSSVGDSDKFIISQIGKKKFMKLEVDSLKVGKKILKYLSSFGKPVFLVPGNWDSSYGPTKVKEIHKSDYNYQRYFLDLMLGRETNKALKSGIKNLYDCQFKLHKFDGVNIIGYGLSSHPEGRGLERSKIKKQVRVLKKSYKKIHDLLSKEYAKRNKGSPTVFLSHNVPYRTKLDKIKNKDSPMNGRHYGSTVAREFCQRYQPLICIGGHMHEHFGKDKIGKTVVANVGFGPYVNTLLEIEDGKIKRLKFYRGKK